MATLAMPKNTNGCIQFASCTARRTGVSDRISRPRMIWVCAQPQHHTTPHTHTQPPTTTTKPPPHPTKALPVSRRPLCCATFNVRHTQTHRHRHAHMRCPYQDMQGEIDENRQFPLFLFTLAIILHSGRFWLQPPQYHPP